MKIAFYIGDHSSDTLLVQAGCWITKLGQKGPYSNVTHCEAIHAEHKDGLVTIASSSLRDKGVRDKRVTLNPAHWIVANVPQWKLKDSVEFLARTKGLPYDLHGALATILPGKENSTQWFCNEWVAYPYLRAASNFGPHHLAAICMSIGDDITEEFFSK